MAELHDIIQSMSHLKPGDVRPCCKMRFLAPVKMAENPV